MVELAWGGSINATVNQSFGVHTMTFPRIPIGGGRVIVGHRAGTEPVRNAAFAEVVHESGNSEREAVQTGAGPSTRSASGRAPLHFSEKIRSLANYLPLKTVSKNSPESIRELEKSIYQEGRYYQGSTKSEVQRWRSEDMNPDRKITSSAVKAKSVLIKYTKDEKLKRYLAAGFDENEAGKLVEEANVEKQWQTEEAVALRHVYFTKEKAGPFTNAASYATMKASLDDPPKINRSFFDNSALEKFEIKPDPVSDGGFRSSRSIPLGYTLQPKTSNIKVTEASEAYKS